ncbi:MAG: hypothetical protein WAO55_15090 [Candidatus Manganitrophaceae bacterium]
MGNTDQQTNWTQDQVSKEARHTEIISETGLLKYLEVEQQTEQNSRSLYQPEFESFCKLFDLYEYLIASIKIGDLKLQIPSDLLLVVTSQMCGVASQLLRNRLTDAYALSRRAIEATAVAHRIWKQPELAKVFREAYPNSKQDEHPKQWRPSDSYKNEFSTKKLFDYQGEVWTHLRTMYEVDSVMATHTGLGALVNHEIRGQTRYLSFISTDNRDVLRAWYDLMSTYFATLKVFIRIFRESWTRDGVGIFEKDVIVFRDKISVLISQRAPWMLSSLEGVLKQ